MQVRAGAAAIKVRPSRRELYSVRVPRQEPKMLDKASLALVFALCQAAVVFAQNQQQPYAGPSQQQLIQGMTPTQMLNPYSWATPYYVAASKAWTDYLKKTQEASNQLYQQWDKTGAANLISMGLDYAQQAAQLAAQQAQQAQQYAQAAMNQAQQGAQMGMEQAQQGMDQAKNLVGQVF